MTRPFALVVAAAAAAPVASQPADADHPKLVLRMSRAFIESLTRQTFDESFPIDSRQKGVTISGTGRASGGYAVAFNKSQTEAAFELRVDAAVDTDVGATRRPVRVDLGGHAPLFATRRVTFDGTTYAAGPVGVSAGYHSTLDGISTVRRGPLSPVIRLAARPVVVRSLPKADRSAAEVVRAKAREKVVEETDGVVDVLNGIHEVRVELTKKLRERKLGPDRDPPALATTDDAILVGYGFPEGSPPTLPATTDGPPAPVEIWAFHKLTAEEALVLKLLEPQLKKEWNDKVKPRFVAQLARHSPELAERVASATHDVRHDLPGADGWHRIRFFQRLPDATPPAP